MNHPLMTLLRLERQLSSGASEALTFSHGVNLFIGPPSSGKTTWLQTFDYLLGDTGENLYEDEAALADKYVSACAHLSINGEVFIIQRRWKEKGSKSKVYVGDEAMPAKDFQHWLMQRLKLPLLHFPKGNPFSGQTWPELSFRMLLRHVYRQQRFWSGIADQQPEGEQHACLLQFLGIAESIFTEDYGKLVELRIKLQKLSARREQYSETLNELAKEILAEPGLTVSITRNSLNAARERLLKNSDELLLRRVEILTHGSDTAIEPEYRGHLARLGQIRVEALVGLEDDQEHLKKLQERKSELVRYNNELIEELKRLERAQDAGEVLSDLRITHCPACDQAIKNAKLGTVECFLCHQHLPTEPQIEGLGVVRLKFEQSRLNGELYEVEVLVELLTQDIAKYEMSIFSKREQLLSVERELQPSRSAVSALTQEEVSSIDMQLGVANERERQLGRISKAVGVEDNLDQQIQAIENQIKPLAVSVDRLAREVDFDQAAGFLEDGMNDYLNSLNRQRPNVWPHSQINVDLSKSSFGLRVGRRSWSKALGGTDTLYFLMAYHYGLLTLSHKIGCHYPGITIIDLPGDFLGEDIGDKENFIVQPFIDLMQQEEFSDTQLIITGAAFLGLAGATTQRLSGRHVS